MDNLPLGSCLPAEFNQGFLNMIVNAAHTIGPRVKNGDYEKGLIQVVAIEDKMSVVVKVIDNGTGNPGINQAPDLRSVFYDQGG